jgi:hypothetical protein
MDGIIWGYSLVGTIAIGCWLVGAGVSRSGRFDRPDHDRWSDRLVLLGLILALAGWTWLEVACWPSWTFTRAGQAAGLAIVALTIHVVLARSRRGVFSTLLVCGFSTGVQMYALGEVWWGTSFLSSPAALPAWAMARDAATLVGCGALAVSVAAMVDGFPRRRTEEHLIPEQVGGAAGQIATENWATRLAWVAFTVSLSLDATRSWAGWGNVMQFRMPWLLVACLLLAASCSGIAFGVMPRRTSRVFVVMSFVAGLLTVLGTVQG